MLVILMTRGRRGRLDLVLLGFTTAWSSLKEVSRVDGRDCLEEALDPRRCASGRIGLVYEEQPESLRVTDELDIELRVLGGPCDNDAAADPA
jgi:hypothetical protein